MSGMVCPQCGKEMASRNLTSHIRRQSIDHILPSYTGARRLIHDDVRNTRVMCQDCNGLTALCLGCVGAAACVRDVARQRGMRRPFRVAREWGFGVMEAEHHGNRVQRVMSWPSLADVWPVA